MNVMTDLQRRTIFAEIRRAAGERGEAPEAYRKRILMEELGVESFSQVSRTEGFNRLMARIKVDQGDYDGAVRYGLGNARAYRFLIERKTKEIIGRDATDHAVAFYAAGIICQMGFSALAHDVLAMCLQREDGYQDFSEDQLRKVVMALSVHLKRQRAYQGAADAIRRKRS